MKKIIYTKYSNERDPKFNIRTEIAVENGIKKVYKYPTNEESKAHIAQMYNTYSFYKDTMNENTVQLCKCEKDKDGVVFEYIEGECVKDILSHAIKNGDIKKIEHVLEEYYKGVIAFCEEKEFHASNEFMMVFGSAVPRYDGKIMVMNPANIDLIFDNIVLSNGKPVILDYEWTFLFDVPMEFILYRGIFYLMFNSPYILKFEELNLFEKFGISRENIEVYAKMEAAFQKYVVGETHAIKEYHHRGIDIKDLVVNKIWEKDELHFSIYEDYGNGFSENSKVSYIQKLTKNGEFEFTHIFADEVKRLRVDPGEMPLVVDFGEDFKYSATNAYYRNENKFYFPNVDPWFEIDLAENQKQITFKGSAEKIGSLTIGEINHFREEIDFTRNELNRNCSELSNCQCEIKELEVELEEAKKQLEVYTRELNIAQDTIHQMLNSTSWKLTKGIRKVGTIIKKLKNGNKVINEEVVVNTSDVIQEVTLVQPVPEIGIHVHLFYTDLLEEFVSYFKNIPYKFNLYFSCIDGADIEFVRTYAEDNLPNVNQVVVKILENRGRDIAPFYVGFGKEIQQHKYVLHVHSKKSKHIETGGGDWRAYSLDSLVGSKELVENIIGRFENEDNLGLVYPECHPDIPMIGYTWMANGDGGKKFLEEIGIPYEDGLFHYPAGSFFWARVQTLKPIFDRNLSYADFPDEQGQIDGTLAHVLERAVVFISRAHGYHSYIVDIKENQFRYDNSTKPYRDYMAVDVEELKERLSQYDSISFGLFDTLITTDFTREEDLYEIVRQKFGLDEEYIRLRKEAQRIAREQKGNTMSLDDAMSILLQISPFEEGGISQLRQAELDAIKQSIYPRYEMREVYRYLVEQGKKISIVSDSCYSVDTIEALLVKSGFIGYEKVYSAADLGYSKQNEHLWNIVYHDYNAEKHIHIGSDVYADWYTLEKRGAKSFWVMSGMEAYKLSKYYNGDVKSLTNEESVSLGKKINREWFNSPLNLKYNDGMI